MIQAIPNDLRVTNTGNKHLINYIVSVDILFEEWQSPRMRQTGLLASITLTLVSSLVHAAAQLGVPSQPVEIAQSGVGLLPPSEIRNCSQFNIANPESGNRLDVSCRNHLNSGAAHSTSNITSLEQLNLGQAACLQNTLRSLGAALSSEVAEPSGINPPRDGIATYRDFFRVLGVTRRVVEFHQWPTPSAARPNPDLSFGTYLGPIAVEEQGTGPDTYVLTRAEPIRDGNSMRGTPATGSWHITQARRTVVTPARYRTIPARNRTELHERVIFQPPGGGRSFDVQCGDIAHGDLSRIIRMNSQTICDHFCRNLRNQSTDQGLLVSDISSAARDPHPYGWWCAAPFEFFGDNGDCVSRCTQPVAPLPLEVQVTPAQNVVAAPSSSRIIYERRSRTETAFLMHLSMGPSGEGQQCVAPSVQDLTDRLRSFYQEWRRQQADADISRAQDALRQIIQKP